MKYSFTFLAVFLITITLAAAQSDESETTDLSTQKDAEAVVPAEDAPEKEDSEAAEADAADAEDEEEEEKEDTKKDTRQSSKKRSPYEPKWKDDDKLEVQGDAAVIVPFDSGMDVGFGAEIKFRYWQWDEWGVGGAIGYNLLSLSGPVSISGANLAKPVADGDINSIPLTVLGCYRWDFRDDMEVIVDLGLQYVIVDSDVSVSTQYIDHFGRDVAYSSFVENEDHFMIAAGLDFRGVFSDDWFWLLGAQVQIDLTADSNWVMEEVGGDLSAITFRGGIGANL